MGVTAEDVRPALADVLRVGGVLEGEQAEESLLGLLVKVIAAVGDSEQISILVTPLKICNLQIKEEISTWFDLVRTLSCNPFSFGLKSALSSSTGSVYLKVQSGRRVP